MDGVNLRQTNSLFNLVATRNQARPYDFCCRARCHLTKSVGIFTPQCVSVDAPPLLNNCASGLVQQLVTAGTFIAGEGKAPSDDGVSRRIKDQANVSA